MENLKQRARVRCIIAVIVAVILLVLILISGWNAYNKPINSINRYLTLGTQYLEEKNYEQAVVEYGKVIAIDPMNLDAYLGKARGYQGMKDITKAIEILQSGYEIKKDEQIRSQMVLLYSEQASKLMQEVDYPGALAVYDKLLDLDGTNVQVQESAKKCLKNYIESLIEIKCYDEAEKLIEKYRDAVSGMNFDAYLDKIEKQTAAEELNSLLSSVPAFDFDDIRIFGYNLLQYHYDEIVALSGCPRREHFDVENNEYMGSKWLEIEEGSMLSTREIGDIRSFEAALVVDHDETNTNIVTVADTLIYQEDDYNKSVTLVLQKINGKITPTFRFGETWCDLPISLGDSYEKWCEKSGVNSIINSSFSEREEEHITDEESGASYTRYIYSIYGDKKEKDVPIQYVEEKYDDSQQLEGDGNWSFFEYDRFAGLLIKPEKENENCFEIFVYFLDEEVQGIQYTSYLQA